MKLNYFTLAALFFIPLSGTAQSENGYQFTTVVQQKATPVKDQAVSGTCWCFATTSFIESELLRQGKGEYDLSEMFIVRQKYLNQMADNLLRHGKGNVTQGSITASWITAFNQVGIVPEEAYTGINYDSPVHNHSELAGFGACRIRGSHLRRSRKAEKEQQAIPRACQQPLRHLFRQGARNLHL